MGVAVRICDEVARQPLPLCGGQVVEEHHHPPQEVWEFGGTPALTARGFVVRPLGGRGGRATWRRWSGATGGGWRWWCAGGGGGLSSRRWSCGGGVLGASFVVVSVSSQVKGKPVG